MSLKPFAVLCPSVPLEPKNDGKSFEASSVRRKLENIDIMSSHLSNS